MSDPLSILASVLTVAEVSKSVISICSAYLTHAKNAPKELQDLLHDLEGLEVTIKKLDEVVRISTATMRDPVPELDVPVHRIKFSILQLERIIDHQDLRLGTRHELAFRLYWPRAWKAIQSVMADIDREKQKVQFQTAIEGFAMVKKVYMLVDERQTSHPISQSNAHGDVSEMAWSYVDPRKPLDYYLTHLGEFLDWPGARYDFPGLDDEHQCCINVCAENSCEVFLKSPAYKGWKNRKTLGPSFLYASGPVCNLANSGKSILCQIIQNLQNSFGNAFGISYFYFGQTPDIFIKMLKFCIVQLAYQGRCLPDSLVKNRKRVGAVAAADFAESTLGLRKYLTSVLISLFRRFKRTFIVLDSLQSQVDEDVLNHRLYKVDELLHALLEQDSGNVSIATFSRPLSDFSNILELSDVSIGLLRVEYRAADIRQYVKLRLERLLTQNATVNDGEYAMTFGRKCAAILNAVAVGSDGLYVAADMFVDAVDIVIKANGDLDEYLREIRESSEIMMQRDPEVMKQKQLIMRAAAAAVDGSTTSAPPDYTSKSQSILRDDGPVFRRNDGDA